jgi:hypothetical protein
MDDLGYVYNFNLMSFKIYTYCTEFINLFYLKIICWLYPTWEPG